MNNTRSLLSLSWQSFAYGVGSFSRKIVVYLTLPLLTRLMGQTEYGIVVIMMAFISLTDTLSDAGLPLATFRLYNEREDAKHRGSVLGSSLFLFVLYALAMVTGIWICAGWLSGWLLETPGNAGLIRIGAVLMLFLTLFSFGDIVYRIQVRPLVDSFANFLLVLAQSVLSLALVGLYARGAYGYWLGQLGGAVIAVLFMAVTLRTLKSLSISTRQMKGLIAYGLPMIPAALAVWALRVVDRPIILRFYTLQDVAIYDLGYKVGSLVATALAPFALAWPQFAFSHMRDEDAPYLYRDVLTAIAAVSTLLGLGIFAFRREIVLLFGGSSYLTAIDVVGWVIVGQIAWVLFPILSIGPRIRKKTGQVAWLTGLAALSNVALNFLLLPRFGIVGAAIATMLAYGMAALGAAVLGRFKYGLLLDYVRLAKLLMAGIVSTGWVVLVESNLGDSALAFVLKVLSLPLMMALLLVSGFIRFGQAKDIAKVTLEEIYQRRPRKQFTEQESGK